MRYTFLFSIFFITCLGLAGCTKNSIYAETRELPDGVWNYPNLLNFEFEISDTLSVYNLDLEIEHSTDFPYQNLYSRIFTGFPSGNRLEKILSLELADKSGKWQGKCSGSRCKLNIPIQENAYFNQVGRYSLALEQYMRQDSLPGVFAVSLMVIKAEKERSRPKN